VTAEKAARKPRKQVSFRNSIVKGAAEGSPSATIRVSVRRVPVLERPHAPPGYGMESTGLQTVYPTPRSRASVADGPDEARRRPSWREWIITRGRRKACRPDLDVGAGIAAIAFTCRAHGLRHQPPCERRCESEERTVPLRSAPWDLPLDARAAFAREPDARRCWGTLRRARTDPSRKLYQIGRVEPAGAVRERAIQGSRSLDEKGRSRDHRPTQRTSSCRR
jgi:hypothetical protein